MLKIYTTIASKNYLARNSLHIIQKNTRNFSSKPKCEKHPATTNKKLKDFETLEDKAHYITKERLPKGILSDSAFTKHETNSQNLIKLEDSQDIKKDELVRIKNHKKGNENIIKNDVSGKFPVNQIDQSQCDLNMKNASTNYERDKGQPENQNEFDIYLMRYIKIMFYKIYDKVFSKIEESLNKPSGFLSEVAGYFRVKNIYLAAGIKHKGEKYPSISMFITISESLKTKPTTFKESQDLSIDKINEYSSKISPFILDQSIPAPSKTKFKNKIEIPTKRFLIIQLHSESHKNNLHKFRTHAYENQNGYLSIAANCLGLKFITTCSKKEYKKIFNRYNHKLNMYPIPYREYDIIRTLSLKNAFKISKKN